MTTHTNSENKGAAESGFQLRVLVFREGEAYVAQCLEKDICVQGKDLEQLFKRLSGTLYLEIPHMGDIPSAPNKFLEMWETGQAMSHKEFLEAPIETRMAA